MPEENGRTDVMQTWRSWLQESERQWNSFFNDVTGTDSFGRFLSTYLEAYSGVQRNLNQGMERYLNTFNLPTHSDVVEIGDRLRGIEERLTSLEALTREVASSVGARGEAAEVTKLRPRRTRRPPSKNSDGA
jgi:hypothetical protein